MSTLREMILTRPRQRSELLEMFSTLSYHETPAQSKGLTSAAAIYDVREQVSKISCPYFNRLNVFSAYRSRRSSTKLINISVMISITLSSQ